MDEPYRNNGLVDGYYDVPDEKTEPARSRFFKNYVKYEDNPTKIFIEHKISRSTSGKIVNNTLYAWTSFYAKVVR